jgi:hypothetical protein
MAEEIVTLWRPVGPAELALIRASGMRAFPPRLPGQPIFYPLLAVPAGHEKLLQIKAVLKKRRLSHVACIRKNSLYVSTSLKC